LVRYIKNECLQTREPAVNEGNDRCGDRSIDRVPAFSAQTPATRGKHPSNPRTTAGSTSVNSLADTSIFAMAGIAVVPKSTMSLQTIVAQTPAVYNHMLKSAGTSDNTRKAQESSCSQTPAKGFVGLSFAPAETSSKPGFGALALLDKSVFEPEKTSRKGSRPRCDNTTELKGPQVPDVGCSAAISFNAVTAKARMRAAASSSAPVSTASSYRITGVAPTPDHCFGMSDRDNGDIKCRGPPAASSGITSNGDSFKPKLRIDTNIDAGSILRTNHTPSSKGSTDSLNDRARRLVIDITGNSHEREPPKDGSASCGKRSRSISCNKKHQTERDREADNVTEGKEEATRSTRRAKGKIERTQSPQKEGILLKPRIMRSQTVDTAETTVFEGSIANGLRAAETRSLDSSEGLSLISACQPAATNFTARVVDLENGIYISLRDGNLCEKCEHVHVDTECEYKHFATIDGRSSRVHSIAGDGFVSSATGNTPLYPFGGSSGCPSTDTTNTQNSSTQNNSAKSISSKSPRVRSTSSASLYLSSRCTSAELRYCSEIVSILVLFSCLASAPANKAVAVQ
jgi:hypothetical protein